MKLTVGLLLSTFASLAYAGSEDAGVYIFQKGEWPSSAKPPVLSPEEARLIMAQRLGVPQYHSIGDENWIQNINKFGGSQERGPNQVPELLLVVEGVTTQTALPLGKPFMSLEAAFKISNPPSSSWTQRLVRDLRKQIGVGNEKCDIEDDIDPFNTSCWTGKSKIISIDLAAKTPSMQQLRKIKDRVIESANNGEMNVAVVFMPESCRSARNPTNPYGTYSMPSQVQLERRAQAEEPMTGISAAPLVPSAVELNRDTSSNDSKLIIGVPKVCHTSLDSCNNATNSCSGHGKCYKKSGSGETACYTCQCVASRRNFTFGDSRRAGFTFDYWGGAACQKKDVSGPFWLLTTFTLVVVGLVAWGISMLFAIGEEKLPGVIGAGVSTKAR
ncbi:hypothetical protein B0O99DRAFT_76907 [Bisporella sp. PMI_857]|nr:hypothetical protein B0O99DRAFT_76907 [Bisporella sp. PMI_857]